MWAAPATKEVAVRTVKVLNEPGVTTMPFWAPVMEVVTVSVAVTERDPAVLRVRPKENAWIPASGPVKV